MIRSASKRVARFGQTSCLSKPFLVEYDRATELMKEFSAGAEKNMRKFLEQKLEKEIVEQHLSPFALTALGYRKNG